VLAGGCWAAYELAVALLLFEAVTDRERTGVITVYNLGLAVATVAGGACGGLILHALGADRTAYAAVFVVSTLVRLAALPLARRVRVAE
jgi:MFS family permease